MFNTAPGCNRWLGAESDNSTSGAQAAAMRALLDSYEPVQPRDRSSRVYTRVQGERSGGGALPTGPTGVRFQVRTSDPDARGNTPQLAFTVSQGYGRVPTTCVHTSAGTSLPSTELQSPKKAAAGTPRASDHPHCKHLFSFSAPCSPNGHSQLYSRTAPLQQQHAQPWSTAPAAVDLLDRLALLRRVAPTTHPAPRPLLLQRHTAAVEHTASPRRAAGPGTAGASRLGAGAGDRDVMAVESPRPLPVAAVPAPGWQYLGQVEPPQGESNSRGHGGPDTETTSCQTEDSCPTSNTDNSTDNVVVVVTHQHCCQGEGSACGGCSCGGITVPAWQAPHRPAFRPAGNLKRRGLRPKSAPPARTSEASRRRSLAAAGLRECGCPKPAPGLAETMRQERRAAEEAARQEEVTVIVTSPRASPCPARPASAGRSAGAGAGSAFDESCRRHHHSVSTAAGAIAGRDASVLVSSPRRVHEDRNVVMVVSPRAGALGGADYVVVAHQHASRSPRLPSSRGSPGPVQPPPAATAAAVVSAAAAVQTDVAPEAPARPTHTLSITIPPGSQHTNYVISANLRSPRAGAPTQSPGRFAAEAGAAAAAAASSPTPGSSRHAAELAALTGEIQRREASFKGMLGELERITAKCSQLASSIGGGGRAAGQGHAHGRHGSGRSAAAELRQGQGSAGVGARSAAAAAAPGVPTACASRAASRAAAAAAGHETYSYSVPLAMSRSALGGHITGSSDGTELAAPAGSVFGSSSSDGTADASRFARVGGSIGALLGRSSSDSTVDAAAASSGEQAAAGWASSAAGTPAAAAEKQWSWESLAELERTIKEQHRKLIEQGLLPAHLG